MVTGNLYKIAHVFMQQKRDMFPKFYDNVASALNNNDDNRLRLLLSPYIVDIVCSKCGKIIIRDAIRNKYERMQDKRYTCNNCVLIQVKRLYNRSNN